MPRGLWVMRASELSNQFVQTVQVLAVSAVQKYIMVQITNFYSRDKIFEFLIPFFNNDIFFCIK